METHCMYRIPILSISLSPNDTYLGILYASGSCQLVNSQSFDIEINLVQHQHDPNTLNWDLSKMLIAADLTELKTVN